MRLRNIKGAKESVLKSNYVIDNPYLYCGKWNTYFKNNNPIHVEIGVGKGKFLIENAILYPHVNFIGIEKYYSVLIKAINQLEGKKLPNLRIIPIDAKEVRQIFHHEIETLYLNFSDPWPKNKHEKRRLTSLPFLKDYDAIFLGKNHIIMKTDNRHLFEYSIISCTSYNYKIRQISLNLHEEPQIHNILTEYEIKFSKNGYPIYRMEIEKID